MRFPSYLHLMLSVALCFAVACGDDKKTPPRPDGGDDDASTDGGGDADAASECAGTATGTFGTAGGQLSLCGAKLTVPPDVLTEETEFGIELAEVPAPAAPDILAGQAFRFWPNDAELPGKVEIELPHDGGTSRIGLQRLVGGVLEGFEPCRVEEDVVAQNVSLLGVFVAVRDPNTYPDGPSGLGTGTITYSVNDVDYTGDVAGGGGLEGYVIDESPFDDSHSITAVLRAAAGDSFSQVDIRLTVSEFGVIDVAQISWNDLETMESANWVSAVHSLDDVDANLTFENGILSGTLAATLYYGETEFTFESTLEVSAEKYRYPGSLSCGNPEG